MNKKCKHERQKTIRQHLEDGKVYTQTFCLDCVGRLSLEIVSDAPDDSWYYMTKGVDVTIKIEGEPNETTTK